MDKFYKPLTKKQLKALRGGDGSGSSSDSSSDSSSASESSSDAGNPVQSGGQIFLLP